MTQDQILAKFTSIFRDVFDDESIVLTYETTAADIEEWDSLNQIKLLLSCERAFNIKLTPRDINTLANVGELVEHLAKVRS